MIPALALLLMCTAIDGDSGHCEEIGLYRLAGIDTPEMHGGCYRSRWLAQRAKEHAVEFMREPVTVEHDGKRDKYRRLLVRITRGGRSLADELEAAGLARRWEGRREGWCG